MSKRLQNTNMAGVSVQLRSVNEARTCDAEGRVTVPDEDAEIMLSGGGWTEVPQRRAAASSAGVGEDGGKLAAPGSSEAPGDGDPDSGDLTRTKLAHLTKAQLTELAAEKGIEDWDAEQRKELMIETLATHLGLE